jgi:hypothetical protein
MQPLYGPTPPQINLASSIQAAIEAMDPWKNSMLANIKSEHSLQELRQLYCDTKGLCGPDGSAQEEKASFGWAWKDREGTLIAKCNGPAPGWHPHSFRMESYAYLSFTRLLLLLKLDVDLIPTSQTVYMDSDSLLKRLAQHRKYSYPITNHTLWPDWNVTKVLHQSIRTVRESWIASHQDDNIAYADLSLPAKLNVDADELADLYLTQHLDPLHYNRPHHHRTIQNRIRGAYSWPKLRTYLEKRFQWDTKSADNIDWIAHGTVISANRKQSNTVVKHLIGQAPTGHIAHQNDNRQDPACLSCGEESESNHHVLPCPSLWVACLRATYLTDILAEFSKPQWHSDPNLTDIL